MMFKDRREAGKRLLIKLIADKDVWQKRKKVVVVSLLRGGVVTGKEITDGLNTKHLPLAVAKIPAPSNKELAIGALCFSTTYLEKEIIQSLNLSKSDISKQIEIARVKFNSYLTRFGINQSDYQKKLKNKILVLADDGIATGSTVKVAVKYLKSLNPESIILAVPITPFDFSVKGIDKEIILHKNHAFGAVSQFYEYFPQIEDEVVKKFLTN